MCSFAEIVTFPLCRSAEFAWIALLAVSQIQHLPCMAEQHLARVGQSSVL